MALDTLNYLRYPTWLIAIWKFACKYWQFSFDMPRQMMGFNPNITYTERIDTEKREKIFFVLSRSFPARSPDYFALISWWPVVFALY